MLLPPGQGKFKELNTSYTRFHLLLQDLAENRFSGYLRLNFWGYEGVLIFDTGKMIQAYSSEKEVYLTGEQAVFRIIHKANEPDGSLDVFSLSNEVALGLALAIQAKLYRSAQELKDLTLREVLQKMENEALTGYVDLFFNQKRGMGTIYYLEGTPVESVIMSHTGKIASGNLVFSRFLEIGSNLAFGAEIYQTVKPHMIQEDRAFLIPWQHRRQIQFWNAVLHLFDDLMKSRLKRSDFRVIFRESVGALADEFSFFSPQHIRFSEKEVLIELHAIVPQKEFFKAVAVALAHALRTVPGRRIRRVNWSEVEKKLSALASQFEVDESKFQAPLFLNLILEKSK